MKPTSADLELIQPGEQYAIDLETSGTDFTDAQCVVQQVGFAGATDCFGFDLQDADSTLLDSFWSRVSTCRLIAYNVMFDGPFVARDSGTSLREAGALFQGCAYVLYKLLTTETPNFQWSLGSAQELVLGWQDTQKDWLAAALKQHGLRKDQMSQLARLERQDYLEYCVADAEGCWQLWQHMWATITHTPHLVPLQSWLTVFCSQIWQLAEQQQRGIEIDKPALQEYNTDLQLRQEQSRLDFLQHRAVQPHVKAYNAKVVEQHRSKEPPQVTKTGKPSKRWEQWNEKLGQIAITNHFNVNSGPMVKSLFFDQLGYTATRYTEAGVPQLDKNLLPRLGEPGKLLAQYRKLGKEQSYVDAAITKVRGNSGIIHPQFRVHGTVTGRLGGSGGLNLQQQPKTRGYLQTWRARRGFKIVQLDYTALEPVVLTQGSRDPNLWKIYGPGQPPNDIYLFVGSHIPAFRDHIRRWYDPDNPTAGGIKLAKKHAKRERGICKTVHLAKQYGAGARKIWSTLVEAGEDVSLEEIMLVSQAWNDLFVGIKDFERQLLAEWEHNKGWIHNGVNRPIAIDESLTKDIVNRYCQSTGHDILLWHLWEIEQRRGDCKMYPWIVDFHDETMWEVTDADIPQAISVIERALARVNKALAWDIPISGSCETGSTLADFKVE